MLFLVEILKCYCVIYSVIIYEINLLQEDVD